MSLSSARLGLRLARREVRRHPWRSALVLLMVLVPTMAMTVAATGLRTGEWSSEARRAAEYGRADLVAHPRRSLHEGDEGRLAASLPAGTFVIARTAPNDRIRTDDEIAYVTVSDLPVDDPIVEGRFGTLHGRTADDEDETVVTTNLADELHLSLGDQFRPGNLDRELTVVGVVDRLVGNANVAYVQPEVLDSYGVPADEDPSTPELLTANLELSVFIDRPDGAAQLAPIPGWNIQSVESRVDLDHDDDLFWVYVGGAVGLFVVGTIVAAAFAVGARRQLRTIGLLSSTGASPRTVRWFLVTQGVVGGALGSMLGVLAAVIAVRLVPDHVVDQVYDRPIASPVTRLSDVALIVLLGTVAGAAAAWFPARSAAKVSTLQAIAGRRPLARVPRSIPVCGAIAVLVGSGLLALAATAGRDGTTNGTVLVLTGILGSVVVLAGTLALAPWAVGGLERLTGRFPHSARLAGRSLARSRVRSSAVVGALCAVIATLVAGATLYRSFNANDVDYEDDVPYVASNHVVIEGDDGPTILRSDATTQVVDAIDGSHAGVVERLALDTGNQQRLVTARIRLNADVAEQFPGMVTYVDAPPAQGSSTLDAVAHVEVGIATPQLLDALEVPGDLRAALDRDEAISVVTAADGVDRVVLRANGRSEPHEVPLGGSFNSPQVSYALPAVLVGEGLADELGFEVGPGHQVLVDAGRPITADERHTLELLNDDLLWTGRDSSNGQQFYLNTPDPPERITAEQVRLAIYAFVLLAIGLVVAIGLGLAAKDAEDESQVLSAVGAPPRTLRRVGALRGVLLVVTATVIATPTGLACSWVVLTAVEADRYDEYYGASTESFPFTLDLPTLGFLLLVPVVVAVIASTWGSIRDRVRPSRPDTLVFAD